MSENEVKKTTTMGSMRNNVHAMILSSLIQAITPLGGSAQNLKQQLDVEPLSALIDEVANSIQKDSDETDKLQNEIDQQSQALQTLQSFGAQKENKDNKKHTSTLNFDIEAEQPEEGLNGDLFPKQPQEQQGAEKIQKTDESNVDENNEENKENNNNEKENIEESDENIGEEEDLDDDKNDKNEPETGETDEQNENNQQKNNQAQQEQIQNTQIQQQIQMQQMTEEMSKQQLKNKLQQLQQEKINLQKKLLDEQDTIKTFKIDQAALFIPSLTVLAYIFDLVDITELLAPLLDFVVAMVGLYWRVTRSIKLKLFYLKKMPEYIIARIFGMIPFASYLFPEMWVEVKNLIERIQKTTKSMKNIPNIIKKIKTVENQIAAVQKQLSSRSIISRFRSKTDN